MKFTDLLLVLVVVFSVAVGFSSHSIEYIIATNLSKFSVSSVVSLAALVLYVGIARFTTKKWSTLANASNAFYVRSSALAVGLAFDIGAISNATTVSDRILASAVLVILLWSLLALIVSVLSLKQVLLKKRAERLEGQREPY